MHQQLRSVNKVQSWSSEVNNTDYIFAIRKQSDHNLIAWYRRFNSFTATGDNNRLLQTAVSSGSRLFDFQSFHSAYNFFQTIVCQKKKKKKKKKKKSSKKKKKKKKQPQKKQPPPKKKTTTTKKKKKGKKKKKKKKKRQMSSEIWHRKS